jgi:hypothetical protein
VSRVRSTIGALAVVGAVAVGAALAVAEVAKPSSVDILFENKHLANVNPGTELVYRFQRTVSKPEILGPGFSDDIKVDVRKAASNGTREVVVKVFTGDRARDPQPIDDLTGNPILVVFLDRSIATYMSVAGGKPAYLKDKFRSAMRERATVEPAKIKIGGKTVDGQKVTVSPFSGDLNATKMRGFENSKFSIIVSDAVPGHFVEMLANFDNTDKEAPTMEERTLMVGAEVVK